MAPLDPTLPSIRLAQQWSRQEPTPISNFFLAGSYTRQDYIDSMEGATMSGLMAAAAILNRPARLARSAAVA